MKEYLINGKTYRLNIFDKIESKEQAYLLGYLLGDGGLNTATHKRTARLFVSSTDKYIVDHFKNEYCPDNTINSKIPVNKKWGIKSKIESHVLNFSSKFSPLFKKHGLLELKDNRDIINIPKKYMKAYLHGLIDSDGHFSWGRRKDRNRLWINFGITHQSLKVLTKVQKYLSEEVKLSSYINPRSDEKCLDLKMSHRDDVTALIRWLYTDTPAVYNLEKEKRAKDFIKEYEALYN